MEAHSSSDLKLLLEKFYLHYNPSKVESISFILESFQGKEIELLVSLKQKYGLLSYDPFDNYIYRLVQVQQKEYEESTVECSFVVPPMFVRLIYLFIHLTYSNLHGENNIASSNSNLPHFIIYTSLE